MGIRVLHLIGGGEIGGAEQHLLHLFNNFKDEEIEPYLGCLIAGSPLNELMRSKGFQTSVFPMKFALDLSLIPSVIRFCRKNKVDIIHAHGARANLIGRLAAALNSINCISTAHSLPEFDYPSSLKGKVALFLDNLTLPFSSGIISVSNSIRESVAERMEKRNKKIPLTTIYNGCPVLDFSNRNKLRDDFRKKWGISDNIKVIGSIGRLHPVKGHSYLISAFKLLANDFPDLHLVIIGDGPLYADLRNQLDRSGLAYTMTGYVTSSWRCLPAMDIFVLPSLSEGMGIVLLEAAQAGIPLIASATGGIPEIWESQIDSLLVKPKHPEEIAQGCKRLLDDTDLRKNLTANALRKSSLLTVERMAEETISFYRSITNGNSPRE